MNFQKIFRKAQDSWAALDDAGDPTGNACFASEWYDYLSERVHDMIRQVDRNGL